MVGVVRVFPLAFAFCSCPSSIDASRSIVSQQKGQFRLLLARCDVDSIFYIDCLHIGIAIHLFISI